MNSNMFTEISKHVPLHRNFATLFVRLMMFPKSGLNGKYATVFKTCFTW